MVEESGWDYINDLLNETAAIVVRLKKGVKHKERLSLRERERLRDIDWSKVQEDLRFVNKKLIALERFF